jgi:hypothetical protein
MAPVTEKKAFDQYPGVLIGKKFSVRLCRYAKVFMYSNALTCGLDACFFAPLREAPGEGRLNAAPMIGARKIYSAVRTMFWI